MSSDTVRLAAAAGYSRPETRMMSRPAPSGRTAALEPARNESEGALPVASRIHARRNRCLNQAEERHYRGSASAMPWHGKSGDARFIP